MYCNLKCVDDERSRIIPFIILDDESRDDNYCTLYFVLYTTWDEFETDELYIKL